MTFHGFSGFQIKFRQKLNFNNRPIIHTFNPKLGTLTVVPHLTCPHLTWTPFY